MVDADFLPRDPEAGKAGATLGARITRAREATDLTSAQLARRLGITTLTLSKWENDRSKPRPNRLVMLAGLLGVSPTWLIEGLGEGPAETQSEVAVLRRELDAARCASSKPSSRRSTDVSPASRRPAEHAVEPRSGR